MLIIPAVEGTTSVSSSLSNGGQQKVALSKLYMVYLMLSYLISSDISQ